MSYSGEYRDYPRPCAEGSHKRAFNGSCHVCGVSCTYDGLSEREAERQRLRCLLTEIADHFDPDGLLAVDSTRGWQDIYADLIEFRSDSKEGSDAP